MSDHNYNPILAQRVAYKGITDVHRVFLQSIVAAGYIPQAAAAVKLREVVEAFPSPLARGGASTESFTLSKVLIALNTSLNSVNFEIKQVRAESDGKLYLVFTNTKIDDLAKGVLDAAERDATLAVMKTVVNCLLERKCVRVVFGLPAPRSPHSTPSFPPPPLPPTPNSGAVPAHQVLGTGIGSLFTQQEKYLRSEVAAAVEGAPEAKIKSVSKAAWLVTVKRLLAQGYLARASVAVEGAAKGGGASALAAGDGGGEESAAAAEEEQKEEEEEEEEGGGGGGRPHKRATLASAASGGGASTEARIFIGPRASSELDEALESKGVERCARCNAVCVSPSEARLATGLRMHIACASGKAEPLEAGDAAEALVAQGGKKAVKGGAKAGAAAASASAAQKGKGKRGRAQEGEEEGGDEE